ncbi:urease accessory protein UreE [Vibrio cyclitrophicus 1F53]|uniref:urease accessory protein UreE n=1 Tax=Vibrio cyclitrophicus TaxID=47951 RepID=UPI00030AAE98|nr:urease accessory protein UreE [Vibrio cyclitrophicus]NOI34615.1 urease accessory protein UreE [Vibrio cyclitrophicus]OEF37673.1 urease accessory protein UreE [Vibrio cyclitrophicus 1F53]OEF64325.1 urease accessory protein UreE [Vibrio cyclitrophicus 1F175]PMH25174.1 urease accessory protein UreE [Vibrio cyclitrophicus]PMH89287.1 urease accessory protein UreE [Vibrio cyclitrophicus]
MIELTHIQAELNTTPDGFLSLPIDSRIKSRLKVTLDDGRNAGLFLPRGHILRGGEQLSSECGLVVEVKAAPETVSTVYCEDLLLLTRVAYHLGNRHVPLQVEAGWVRYQHDHVLDEMVEGLGAKVTTETQPFEPEGGAYGGRSGGHHHHH